MSTHWMIRPTPQRMVWLWLASALVGVIGLSLSHGFTEPLVPASVFRIILAVAVGLFVLSRLVILVPVSALGTRLKRWWPDYLLILAGLIWWLLDRSKEPIILEIGAAYSILWGAFWAAIAGLVGLTRDPDGGPLRPFGAELLVAAMFLALVGGVILALPICWSGGYPVNWDETWSGQSRYELAHHLLDTTFTAAAALTGCGISILDLGQEFNRTGQAIILALMQIGALVTVIAGACIGWRFRELLGWGAIDDDRSSAGLRRLVMFSVLFCLVVEAIGIAVLYGMWPSGSHVAADDTGGRLFYSAFHAVSAFCNVGLSLADNQMIDYREHYAVFAGLLPLMVLGSIGGPVMCELLRRLVRHRGLGMECLSLHAKLSLLALVLLLGLGTVGLKFVESTPEWQLHRTQSQTPGRLQRSEQRPDTLPINHSGGNFAASQRLSGLSGSQQWLAALYMSAAGRNGGLPIVRTDENSLAPASRVILNGLTVLGGEFGGTTGGLGLVTLWVLLGAVVFLPTRSAGEAVMDKNYNPAVALRLAAGLLIAMMAMLAATSLVLFYREAGSPLSCATEAVNAVAGGGLSAGLTPHLSTQGQVTLILAMLLGKVIPLLILLRSLRYVHETARVPLSLPSSLPSLGVRSELLGPPPAPLALREDPDTIPLTEDEQPPTAT